MNYTITKNKDGFTNLNAADYLIQFFDLMRQAQKGWPLFEQIYGGPFDIKKFTPDDYVFHESDGNGIRNYDDSWWGLDIGNGWALKVQISKIYVYGYYRNNSNSMPPNSNDATLMVSFTHNKNWCYHTTVNFAGHTIAQMPHEVRTSMAESYWKSIFDAIKRRAAITIREHRNYLANPSFYDTLERELNIKVRKKK